MKTTKTQIKADFTYARHLMRLIDEQLKKPTTLENLEELDQLTMELTAATGSAISYYIDEQRETLRSAS